MTKRHRLAVVATVTAMLFGAGAAGAWTGAPGTVIEGPGTDQVREIVFPVVGDVHFVDTWLYPRSSGRRHVGVDLMGDKMLPILAVRDSCVTRLTHRSSGNMLVLEDEDGWQYNYIHLNNDTPGTDDGANPIEYAFPNGLAEGDCVEAGTLVSYLGDSGNAEATGAHLHFEMVNPDGLWVNPYPSVAAAEAAADPNACRLVQTTDDEAESALSGRGLWVLGSDGSVVGLDTETYGDLATDEVTTAPVAIRSTPTGDGYWIVDADGVVHPYGDAAEAGDMSGVELNGPVLGLEAHPGAGGYWLVASDGGVFTFGDALFHGSMGSTPLNQPVISMASSTTGAGYWLVAADGGVFTFGDALFHGSTGSMELAAPVISMTVHPDGDGYWLYAEDGGVFSFSVPFHGSVPGLNLCDQPDAVSMRVTDTGDGYWVLAADGRTFTFGDAATFGAAAFDEGITAVDLAVRHHPADSE